jgi:6-phosphogluconolactonase
MSNTLGRVMSAIFALFVFFGIMGIAVVAQTTGAVYVNTNATSNEVWAYARAVDGTLSFAGAYSTQGKGAVSNLNSQGAVILSPDGKFLFAVNAGSNDITVFSVTQPGQLAFVQRARSGGNFPKSLTMFGGLLYVLNGHGTSHINAFKVGPSGTLTPISNSSRNLSTALPTPAQVNFNLDGTLLVVAEIKTNKIDTYTVGTDGRATGPVVQNSAGPGPFGFAFDKVGHLIVSELNLSSVSSYTLSPAGVLTTVTGALVDFGKAACWVANTNNPSFPNQYSYVTNTGNATISGFRIGADGSLTLLNSNGRTFVLPKGADPLDMALSSDSNYLYALEGSYGGIVGFQIQPDGSLVQVTAITGTPTSSYGLTGN